MKNIKENEIEKKPKVEIYCKNPLCFNTYLARHKIKEVKENEIEKEKLFEKIWSNYWWKLRGFGYRCSNNEETEREIIATALESFLQLKSSIIGNEEKNGE